MKKEGRIVAFVQEAQSNGLLRSVPLSNLEQVYMYLDPQSTIPLSRANKKLHTIFQETRTHFSQCNHSSRLPAEFYERFAVSKRNPQIFIEKRLLTQNDRCLGISDNRKVALSSSSDKTVKLWDIIHGKCIRIFLGFKSSASNAQISPDGTKALLVDSENITFWDLQSGQHLHTLKGHESTVDCLLMTFDGKRALSGSCDKTLKLWDLTSGKCVHTLRGHESMVDCLQIRADGKLALSGSSDGVLILWDLTEGKCIRTIKGHENSIQCLEISSDGQMAISGSSDKKIKVWNLATGECMQTLAGHEEGVTHLQVIPGEKKVLSSSWDRTLKLWDFTTGECLFTLRGHGDSVALFKISSDGKIALSSSTDGVIKLWDLITGQCLDTIKMQSIYWATCFQIAPDGVKAFIGGICKEIITILNLKPLPQELMNDVARAFRRLSIEESMEKFDKLPSFVKRTIDEDLKQLYPTASEAPTDPEYNKGFFHSLRSNERAAVLESYIVREFLPDVAELFRAAERERLPIRQYISPTHPNRDCIRSTTLQRIPPEIWSYVYDFLGLSAVVLSLVSKPLNRSQRSIRCYSTAAYDRFAHLPLCTRQKMISYRENPKFRMSEIPQQGYVGINVFIHSK